MADSTITDLPVASAIGSAELIHIVQGGISKKVSIAKMTGSRAFFAVTCDDTVSSYEFAIPDGCDVANISAVDLGFSSATLVGIQLSSDGGSTWVNGTYDYRVVKHNDAVNAAFGDDYMPAYLDPQSGGTCFKGRVESLQVAMPTAFDFGDLHNSNPYVLLGYTKGAIGPHNAIRIFTTNGNNFVSGDLFVNIKP
ncbi:MAG: hypothetical protein COA84_15055 [Robiginitomaculum sp.]|nr:MAG: hypothetical protein COA84_15055 [Robiginitomaculum sp.]